MNLYSYQAAYLQAFMFGRWPAPSRLPKLREIVLVTTPSPETKRQRRRRLGRERGAKQLAYRQSLTRFGK